MLRFKNIVIVLFIAILFTGCFAPKIQYQDKNSIMINHRQIDIGKSTQIAKEYCIKQGYSGVSPVMSIPDRARRATTFECK